MERSRHLLPGHQSHNEFIACDLSKQTGIVMEARPESLCGPGLSDLPPCIRIIVI